MPFKKRLSNVINFNSDIFIQKLENDPFYEYSKEKLIGKGAYGEVYLVKHNKQTNSSHIYFKDNFCC